MENGKDGLNILGHELGHGYGAKTEAEANEYGSKVVQGFERESKYQGKGGFQAAGNNLNVPKYSWQELNQNSPVIQAGNTGVDRVVDSDKKLYLYNGIVVGTTGVNDHKVKEIGDSTLDELGFKVDMTRVAKEYADVEGASAYNYEKWVKRDEGGGMFLISPMYDKTYKVAGVEYNLDNPRDYEKFKAKTDMNYVMKGTQMIYYENGMENNKDQAQDGAHFLEKAMGLKKGEAGVLNNITHGLMADIEEYKNPLDRKDILNAYAYEKISQNGERNLIVMFSAGNKDALKAMEVLKLENRSLGGKVDFMSMGSPIGKKELTKAAEKVGANIIGQYNDRRDPVPYLVNWIGGTLGFAATTAIAGIGIGIAVATNPASITAAEIFSDVLIGGGIGGGIMKHNLTKYHSFESYLNRNVKEVDSKEGVQDSLRKWKERYAQSPLVQQKPFQTGPVQPRSVR